MADEPLNIAHVRAHTQSHEDDGTLCENGNRITLALCAEIERLRAAASKGDR